MVLRPPMHFKHDGPSLKVRWSIPTRRSRRAINLLVTASVVLMVSLLLSFLGCQQQILSTSRPGGYVSIPVRPTLPLAQLGHEPIVRIRIVRRQNKIVINAHSDLIIGPTPSEQGRATPARFTPPVTITKHPTGYAIMPANGQGFAWGLKALQITTQGHIQVNGTSYPQKVMIHHSRPTKYDPAPNSLDAVNYVAIEKYLPGVLEKELYSKWHPGAFTAQAIAARSYAIVQHFANQNKHYDMEAGTASQAYAGAHASLKARNAVSQTRGMVLVYDNRIVPGYYSSSCGGSAQDAAIAFPNGQNITPLQAHKRAAWCTNSQKFRWGPITRNRLMLSQRIRAWGVKSERKIAKLGQITQIQITKRNRTHRPAEFTLTDHFNHRYVLGPEAFRFACNFSSKGSQTLAKLSSKQKLYSSHLNVQVVGNTVQISDGRGFGHGVGLCQFGAQGMAIAGLQPEQILRTYYPGSQIRRAY
ncbi:MAG: SpoIID/LytB domain-containing protein [Phycisphaeraceae bacterium]|nr:SpoIID/LytB domain-containing protein [Phycisphaeraceae bacterium]